MTTVKAIHSFDEREHALVDRAPTAAGVTISAGSIGDTHGRAGAMDADLRMALIARPSLAVVCNDEQIEREGQ